MKKALLVGGLLVGLVLLYVFVVGPLLKPEAPPKDALGNAINGGLGVAGDALGKGVKLAKFAATSPLKVLNDIFTTSGKSFVEGAFPNYKPGGGHGPPEYPAAVPLPPLTDEQKWEAQRIGPIAATRTGAQILAIMHGARS